MRDSRRPTTSKLWSLSLEYFERESEIRLPESYKRALVPFRIPAMYGSTDHQLWGDAEGLVLGRGVLPRRTPDLVADGHDPDEVKRHPAK